MINFNFKTKFWSVVIIQIIILISVLGWNQIQLATGEEILLKLTPPRDPLSLFQGHYLVLNYEISQLDADEYSGPSDFKPGEKIYVILEKEDNYWKAQSVSRYKPKERIFIQGDVTSNYNGNLRIIYGIESYFIPEKEAGEIEKLFRELQRDQNIFIELSINKSGKALIREILIGEAKVDFSELAEPESKEEIPTVITVKQKDVRIISAISQARTVMVYIYVNEGNYDNFSCQHSDMREVCAEISKNSRLNWVAIAYAPKSNSQEACIYAPLNSKPNFWYCADSSGAAGFTTINPGGTGYCVWETSAKCSLLE